MVAGGNTATAETFQESPENSKYQGAQREEFETLKRENKNSVSDLQNKSTFEQAIESADTIEKQRDIQKYLGKIQDYPFRKDFFSPIPPSQKSAAEMFFENPSIIGIQTAETLMKKQVERTKKWGKVVSSDTDISLPPFKGETSNEFAEFVGAYYEMKIMKQTAPPGKDPLKRIGKRGTDNFRWTSEETTKNLQWKKRLVDGKQNPMAFFDWLEGNMRDVANDRGKQITSWAEKNVKTAEKHPQLFSPKYLEKLKEIATDAKAGKPNHYPIELLKDFEKIIIPEQRKERLKLEKEAGKKFDIHAKLIGPKNVIDWKGGWLKEAPLNELQDWFKNGEFEKELKKLQDQASKFEKELKKSDVQDKEAFQEYFWSLNGEERNSSFSELSEKFSKVFETQKTGVELLTQKQDLLTEEELETLQSIGEKPQAEQDKLVTEIQRNVEKRDHLLKKFQVRDGNFEKEIANFEAGHSLKELDEILSPMFEIHESLKSETCKATLDALHKCEEIRANYKNPEDVKQDVTEADFLALFQEDQGISTLLLAEAWEQKHEEGQSAANQNREKIEQAQDGDNEDLSESYKEALQEYEKEELPETANDNKSPEQRADQLENQISHGSEYFKKSVHEDPTFEEKFQEAEDRKANEIVKGNDDIRNSIEGTKNNVVRLDLSNQQTFTTLNKMTGATGKKLREKMQIQGSVEMTDTGKNATKEKKKSKITKFFQGVVGKAFGDKEAGKFSTQDYTDTVKNLRTKLAANDNDEAQQRKLAKELARKSNIRKIKKKAA